MNTCKKVVPGFEKRGLTCGDFISDEMRKVHLKMKAYEKENTK